jgi:hypothetical protein
MRLKMLALAIGLIVSQEAPAGFLTGVVVGSVLSSNGSKETSPSQNTTVISDTNNVLACEKIESDIIVSACRIEASMSSYNAERHCHCITPEEYTKKAGYSKLLKVGTQFYDGKVYLLLEVSK